MVFPDDTPIVRDLHTSYIHVPRLLDYYKGSGEAGRIHFKNGKSEAAVFFGMNSLINAYFRDSGSEIRGTAAIERIMQITAEDDYFIDIYSIPEDMIFFWANITKAHVVFENLSTDLTDIDKLINKITAEQTSNIIEIYFESEKKTAMLYFYEGKIVGFTCPWCDSDSVDTIVDTLRQETQNHRATFTVKAISLQNETISEVDVETPSQLTGPDLPELTMMFAELLREAEKMLATRRKNSEPFGQLLRKKCIEKADQYPFLDPFADEFNYSNGEIVFDSDASAEEFGRALSECLVEIASDSQILEPLAHEASKIREKYSPSAGALLSSF
ncbi:MAG: hypothetical protein JRI89_10000 [Deltaproteobacteria bacterium]|nr:hypothetical protein [Deltaproteobacteria bacterium]